jgi:hypothetical protein
MYYEIYKIEMKPPNLGLAVLEQERDCTPVGTFEYSGRHTQKVETVDSSSYPILYYTFHVCLS